MDRYIDKEPTLSILTSEDAILRLYLLRGEEFAILVEALPSVKMTGFLCILHLASFSCNIASRGSHFSRTLDEMMDDMTVFISSLHKSCRHQGEHAETVKIDVIVRRIKR